mgnify:CR=1 FL=1
MTNPMMMMLTASPGGKTNIMYVLLQDTTTPQTQTKQTPRMMTMTMIVQPCVTTDTMAIKIAMLMILLFVTLYTRTDDHDAFLFHQ